MQTYLTSLREWVNPTTDHLHFSKLRAFFHWCVESGLLSESPLRGVTVTVPRPSRVFQRMKPSASSCRAPCSSGLRMYRDTLVALLADSGLRISEALRINAA